MEVDWLDVRAILDPIGRHALHDPTAGPWPTVLSNWLEAMDVGNVVEIRKERPMVAKRATKRPYLMHPSSNAIPIQLIHQFI